MPKETRPGKPYRQERFYWNPEGSGTWARAGCSRRVWSSIFICKTLGSNQKENEKIFKCCMCTRCINLSLLFFKHKLVYVPFSEPVLCALLIQLVWLNLSRGIIPGLHNPESKSPPNPTVNPRDQVRDQTKSGKEEQSRYGIKWKKQWMWSYLTGSKGYLALCTGSTECLRTL